MSDANRLKLKGAVRELRTAGMNIEVMGSMATGEVVMFVGAPGDTEPGHSFKGNVSSPELDDFVTGITDTRAGEQQ